MKAAVCARLQMRIGRRTGIDSPILPGQGVIERGQDRHGARPKATVLHLGGTAWRRNCPDMSGTLFRLRCSKCLRVDRFNLLSYGGREAMFFRF